MTRLGSVQPCEQQTTLIIFFSGTARRSSEMWHRSCRPPSSVVETALENWAALRTARTKTTIDSCYELAMSSLPYLTYHRKSKEIPRHVLGHPSSPGVLMAQGRSLRGQPGSRMNQPLFENTYHANRSVAGSSTACKGLSVTKSCLHEHRMHRHACNSILCNGTTQPLRHVCVSV